MRRFKLFATRIVIDHLRSAICGIPTRLTTSQRAPFSHSGAMSGPKDDHRRHLRHRRNRRFRLLLTASESSIFLICSENGEGFAIATATAIRQW